MPPAPRVLAISPSRTGPWVHELDALRDAGVEALMLRLTDEPAALETVLAAAVAAGLTVLVRPVRDGDVARAWAAGAGIHQPDRDPPTRSSTYLASTSCHDAERVQAAGAAGLDLCTLAPVFPPGSKPDDLRAPLGLTGLRAAAARAPGFPILALGGVRAERVPDLLDAGAHGIAGITGFFDGGRVDRAGATRIAAAVAAHRAGSQRH